MTRKCLPHAAALLLLLGTLTRCVEGANTSSRISTISTCQSRTVNYITHTLPQQCLKTGWAGLPTPVADTGSRDNGTKTEVVTDSIPSPSPVSEVVGPSADLGVHAGSQHGTALESISTQSVNQTVTSISTAEASSATPQSPTQDGVTESDQDTESLLDNANFLSFEEWKRKNLERRGQSADQMDEKRRGSKEHRRRPVDIENVLDSLGDDTEMDLDFGGFVSGSDAADEPGSWSKAERKEDGHASQAKAQEGDDEVRGAPRSRSKDAGKTWAGRFNYASFDCAATVLRTNTGSKGSSSILVENKDSYMLNECSANNKFLIIELCEDILVDTVVLANFEFFSSTFRSFRVSVSDRYSAKVDRWKELGVFEAGNTRDIQAFSIQNPLIWARYLRVEFLTHYGNEFYCPLSLLRVHGTTMMEELRNNEGQGEDDGEDEAEEVVNKVDEAQDTAPAKNVEQETESEALEIVQQPAVVDVDQKQDTGPYPSDDTGVKPTPTEVIGDLGSSSCDREFIAELEQFLLAFNLTAQLVCKPEDHTVVESIDLPRTTTEGGGETRFPAITLPATVVTGEPPAAILPAREPSATPSKSSKPQAVTKDATPSAASENQSKQPNPTSQDTRQSHSSNTSPPHASPTTQESFFKIMHKRLQLLESNATLSLQYIEEQSRILRDAFMKVEKRQLTKTTNFLENLNATVLTELRNFRQMYDLLWQSTVIELETQREQSQKEILAISARLSFLADEVLFQKRMSIVQSVLLLLCLGLVLFSRGPASAYLELPILQSILAKSQSTLRSPFDSPPGSPRSASSTRPPTAVQDGRKPIFGHSRQLSDESTSSQVRSPTLEFSPPTPSSGTTFGAESDSPDNHRRRSGRSNTSDSPEYLGGLERSHSSPAAPGGAREVPAIWQEAERDRRDGRFLSPDRAAELHHNILLRENGPLSQEDGPGYEDDEISDGADEELEDMERSVDDEGDDGNDDDPKSFHDSQEEVESKTNPHDSSNYHVQLLSPPPEEPLPPNE